MRVDFEVRSFCWNTLKQGKIICFLLGPFRWKTYCYNKDLHSCYWLSVQFTLDRHPLWENIFYLTTVDLQLSTRVEIAYGRIILPSLGNIIILELIFTKYKYIDCTFAQLTLNFYPFVSKFCIIYIHRISSEPYIILFCCNLSIFNQAVVSIYVIVTRSLSRF